LKAIILAAGYATRLYPLTKNLPRTLLPIAGKPILEYTVEQIAACPGIDRIFLVTNNLFFPNFARWLNTYSPSNPPIPEIVLVDDGTRSNAERRGSIGDLLLAIESQMIDDDTLVICSDKMFEFKLSDFVECFKKRREAMNACFDTGDVEEIRGKHGCVVLDRERKIVEFQEKPDKPKSTIQSIAFYIFPGKNLPLVQEYLEGGGTPDAPGFLVQWLCQRIPLYAYIFSEPCFDVGTPETYRWVDRLYRSRFTNEG